MLHACVTVWLFVCFTCRLDTELLIDGAKITRAKMAHVAKGIGGCKELKELE